MKRMNRSQGLMTLMFGIALVGCDTAPPPVSPPPAGPQGAATRPGADVKVDAPGVNVDVDRKPGPKRGIDVNVDQKPGGGVDIDIKR